MSLERALQGLLHDPGVRRAWRDGSDLGLSSDDAASLRALDPDEVERAASMVRNALLTRRHLGCGGLRKAFPRTLLGRDLGDVLDTFQAHPTYAAYREIPFGGDGLCLEEAFFRFAEHTDLGDALVRRHEYLVAAARALVVSPDPAFLPPTGFRRVEGGWAATDGERIYAAVGGRLFLDLPRDTAAARAAGSG